MLRLERTSKAVLRTHTFLWGKVFVVKHGGRNNSNWGLKSLVNIEIAKALILLISNCTVHVTFLFWWNLVGPVKHNTGRCLEKSAKGRLYS